MLVVAAVKHRQVEHVTATVPACRHRVTECRPVGHILESPENIDVMGGSLRSNPLPSRRHEPVAVTVLPNAQTVPSKRLVT